MMLALLIGCTGAEGQDSEKSPATDGVTAPCADQPQVNWANFGEGFMLGYCQPCHASAAPDRHGAPDTVTFDSEADVVTWAERIRVRVLTADVSMPPGGGVPAAELELLEVWLDCGLGG